MVCVLLELEDINELRINEFYHKSINDNLPPYFDELKILIEPITRRYDTRYSICPYLVRNDYAKDCLKYQLINLLNRAIGNGNNTILTETNNILHEIIININLLPYIQFIKFVSQYIISLYRYECTIYNCFVCSSK